MRSASAVLAAALALPIALDAAADPIPLGAAFEPMRLRNQVLDAKGALYGWDDLEVSREGDRIQLRWALTRPDGTAEIERSDIAIREGLLIPLELRREERNARGETTRAAWADGLEAPNGEVTLHSSEGDDDEDTDVIDVDDTPLYPSAISGSILQAIIDREHASVQFTILVEYPWGLGPARLEASALEDRPAAPSLLGEEPTRRVHLKALHSWLVDLAIRMLRIDTNVYLDVARELPGRPLVRYSGPIAYDSGSVSGRLVAFRRLADGERLDTWPPPIEGYGPDAMPVTETAESTTDTPPS